MCSLRLIHVGTIRQKDVAVEELVLFAFSAGVLLRSRFRLLCKCGKRGCATLGSCCQRSKPREAWVKKPMREETRMRTSGEDETSIENRAGRAQRKEKKKIYKQFRGAVPAGSLLYRLLRSKQKLTAFAKSFQCCSNAPDLLSRCSPLPDSAKDLNNRLDAQSPTDQLRDHPNHVRFIQ